MLSYTKKIIFIFFGLTASAAEQKIKHAVSIAQKTLDFLSKKQYNRVNVMNKEVNLCQKAYLRKLQF